MSKTTSRTVPNMLHTAVKENGNVTVINKNTKTLKTYTCYYSRIKPANAPKKTLNIVHLLV
jgi:hypothetical protein